MSELSRLRGSEGYEARDDDMTDIDYGAVFGTEELVTTAGEEETEVAEPSETESTDNTAQGEEAQEAADPAETINLSRKRQRERQSRTPILPPARRRAEAQRDAAIEKAKADAQAEAKRTIEQFFRNSGLVNPYTKTPITTKAEYEAYRERF